MKEFLKNNEEKILISIAIVVIAYIYADIVTNSISEFAWLGITRGIMTTLREIYETMRMQTSTCIVSLIKTASWVAVAMIWR